MRFLFSLFKVHRCEWRVFLFAMALFALLVSVMVAYTTGNGNQDVLRTGVVVSGFDNFVYYTIKKWHICYSVMRHPLLSPMLWPLSVLDGWLRPLAHQECNAYIVGVVWWVMDCYTFLFLYRFLRRIVSLRRGDSFVLTVLFFSLGYVMLAATFPDHMVISMFLLSWTLLACSMRMKHHRPLPLVGSLFLFFVSAGVSTTNGVKLLMADFIAHFNRGRWGGVGAFFRRYLWFVIPALLLYGAYYYQEEHIWKPAIEQRMKARQERMKKDENYAKKMTARAKSNRTFQNKQLVKGRLFEFTDATVERIPSLWHNVFGEGLQIHSAHLLQDSHGSKWRRPLFVPYTCPVQYAIEFLLLAFLVAGIVCGIRCRFLWIPLSWFLFDMLLHVGLNFAINDVYIMTAHWALIFPAAYACLLKRLRARRTLRRVVSCVFALLALYLFVLNGGLMFKYCIVASL